MKKALIVFLLCLSSCAAQQPLVKETNSGNPEGVFAGKTVEDTKSVIIAGCSRMGSMATETDGNQVVCEKEMEGNDAILAQWIIGNSYSTDPIKKARFVMYREGANTVAVVNQWVETQMAFGQVRKIELKSNNQKNDMQNFLFSLGAK